MAYNYRYIQDNLLQPPSQFSALLITGARRTGKSTLAEALLKAWGGSEYYSFDSPLDIDRFRKDPELFFRNLKTPAVLDEVQQVPDIFSYIKSYVDRHKDNKCLFILTGSQQFQMMKNASESLAGRVLIKDLYPFSLGEMLNTESSIIKKRIGFLLDANIAELKANFTERDQAIDFVSNHLLYGGYPPLIHINDEGSKRDWFLAYLQTYIQRDVRALSNVHDLSLFNRFVSLIAGRCAHIINYSELGKDLGMTFKTAQHYLSLLETSYIWRSIPAYYLQAEKRLTKRAKGIFLDVGLSNYLTGIFSLESLHRNSCIGMIFESFIISEFIKLLTAFNFHANIFFLEMRAEMKLI